MVDEDALTAARRAMVEDLYDRYSALVYRTCRAILDDHHAAEDAAQEVYARLFSHGDPASVRDPRRWLLEVTRNHCIDRRRAAARRPTTPIDNGRPAAEDAEARSLARVQLRWLLSLLTPRQRDVMVRQAVLDEPLDTVASRLGLSYAAASQLLYRARLVLARAAGGDAAVVVAAGRIAGLGRRLQALVLRFAGAGRLEAGRMPLDAALALPIAALVIALLAGEPAGPHQQAAPSATAPIIQVAGAVSGVRGADGARRPAAVAEVVHGPAFSAAAPAPSHPPVPTHIGTKGVPGWNRPVCIDVAGIGCVSASSPATVSFGLGGLGLP